MSQPIVFFDERMWKMSEIDSLEIKIEASAKKANESLEKMNKKLNDVGKSLKDVLTLSDGIQSIGNIELKGIKELEKDLDSISEIQQKVSKKTVSPKVETDEIKKAAKTLDDLYEKFKTAGRGIDVSKLGFSELNKALKKSESDAKRLNERLEKKIATEGTEKLGKSWESLVFDIQKATNQTEIYREALEKLKKSAPQFTITRGEEPQKSTLQEEEGRPIDASALNYDKGAMKAVFGEDAADLENFNDVMERFGKNASEASNAINQLENSLDENKIQTYEAQIKKLKDELGDLAKKGFHEGDAEYDKKAKELALLTERQKAYNKANRNAAQDIIKEDQIVKVNKFSSALKNASNIMKKTVSIIKKISSQFSNLSKMARIPIKALGKIKNAIIGVQKQSNKGMSLGKMIGSSIAFSTVFQMISLIERAIAEGSNNLTQYSGEYNNSISSMVSSLLYLKNAWAVAFAPIVNVVSPYISKFIDMIATALNKVAQFIATLTGKSIVVQAKKQWKDYGASLGEVGSSASDAAKEMEELKDYTLGIDELNIQPKDNPKGESGSGGGGTGGSGEISPSEMFETIEPSGAVSDFAKRIREAFLNEDWEELGKVIAQGFNTGLQYLYDVMNWDNVGPHVTKFISDFSDTFNSFVNYFDWDLLGRTIGTGINTIVNTLNLLIESIDWVTLGSKFAIGINGLFNEIEWENLGAFFGNKFMIFWETAYGVVSTLEWGSLGKDIANGLNGMFSKIDIGIIGASLGKAITGISKSAIDFAKNFEWGELGENIASGINNLFIEFDAAKLAQGATALISGLLDTIIFAISETDWTEIWIDIIDFLVNVDWAGLLAKIAVATLELVYGILDGLAKAVMQTDWAGVWEDIVSSLKSAFGTIGEWFSGKFSEAVELTKETFSPIINWFKEKWNDIVEIFSPVAEWFKKKFGNAYENIKNAFSFIGVWFQDKWNSIKSVFQNAPQWFKEKFGNAYNAIVNIFKSIGAWFGDRWTDIKNVFSPIVSWFSEKFSSAYTGIKNVFSGIGAWFGDRWTDIKNVFSPIATWFSEAFQKAYDGVKNIWDGLGEFFKGIARNALSPIETLVNGIINGVNWVMEKVGSDLRLDPWPGVKFAKGSDGVPQNTLGVVNDQPGSTYKELIVPPHGKPFIPNGRNVMLPLEKGTKIMPANQTKALMSGMPHFAGGIGDFLSGAWEAVKGFTGDVFDYLKNPGEIVKIALDKFVGLGDFFEPWLSIAGGIVNLTFDGIVSFVSGIFDKIVPKVDYVPGAGVEQWRDLAKHALQMTGQYTEKNLDLLLMQMGTESGGNPNAINNWDINAQNGTPSKGLMQVIDPTFRTYAYPGYNTDIYDPLSNILASIQYTLATYGSLANGWRGVGYANGIGKISLSDLFPAYSVGGFPEDGLFMANHTELVGQFANGKTAVANNLQIEKGIEEAAYRGVSRANMENREQENLLRELIRAVKDGKRIVIDGRELVSVVEARQSRNGFSFT